MTTYRTVLTISSAMLRRVLGLALVGVALAPAVGSSAVASAQQSSANSTLVFDSVTVIDVQQGRRLRAQRVVIVGNRIRTVGSVRTVRVPAGARVVNARGKYLIPGLWDMHTHSQQAANSFFYPLFIANGVTGIRDAWSEVPLDMLQLWRREILAGTRVGPPRQILSGRPISERHPCREGMVHACADDSARARLVVDSLKAAGADMLKTYDLGRDMYFAVAAEARRVHIPFGGHLEVATAIEASDSGASILDHPNESGNDTGSVGTLCINLTSASVARCRPVAKRFRQNGTWWVPTFVVIDLYGGNNGPPDHPIFVYRHRSPLGDTLLTRWHKFMHAFWADSAQHLDLRHGLVDFAQAARACPGFLTNSTSGRGQGGLLSIAHQVGLPILAGTDVMPPDMGYSDTCDPNGFPPGFSIHTELALYVAEGLTPLEALQTATLNPAKLLHGTDSLGTVAAGKLADLVLLDADPLMDITNTTMIRAVVANGRYFDRPALDQLIAVAQKAHSAP